jgi:hypothetical protein
VSSLLSLLAAGVLIFSCLFFMWADYSWERQKRGSPAQAGSGYSPPSQRGKVGHSWSRYLKLTMLAYVITLVLIESQAPRHEVLLLPTRMAWTILLLIFLSVIPFAIDTYWDRKGHGGPTKAYTNIFWLYFWLKYPVLIAVTIAATARGLAGLFDAR